MKSIGNHTILLRADSGKSKGFGHLNRLLSVAYILKNDFKIIFITNEKSANIKKMILNVCDEVFYIPNFINSFEEAIFLSEKIINGNEIVVLDGYQFDTKYQIKIKNNCSKLVCIDDEAKDHFVADLVFNHAPGICPEDYKKEESTKLCLGLDYLMLRPSFSNQQNILNIKSKSEVLFICFGGSDNSDYSRKITEIVLHISTVKKIILVTGPYYSVEDDWIENLQTDNKHFYAFQDLNEQQMFEQMSLSDVLIVPSSTMSLEGLSLNKILLTGITETNQQKIHDGILPLKQVFSITNFNKLTQEKLISTIQYIFDKRGEDISRILIKSNHFFLKEFKLL